MERMHNAIDDLYDAAEPARQATSEAYLRVEDEYNNLHKIIAAEINGITLKEAFSHSVIDYMKGH